MSQLNSFFPQHTPQPTITSMSSTLQCVSKQLTNLLETNPSKNYPRILLVVTQFVDGSRPIPSWLEMATHNLIYRSNGEAMDSGKYSFESVLVNTVPNRFIAIVGSTFQNLELVAPEYNGQIPKSKIRAICRQYNVSKVLIVRGVFSQWDESGNTKGSAATARQEGSSVTVDAGFGHSINSRTIALQVSMIDPNLNIIIGSTELSLTIDDEAEEANLSIGAGEFSIGFSDSTRIIDSPGGAQRTLIEAASLWLIGGLFGNTLAKSAFERCVYCNDCGPSNTIIASQCWRKLSSSQRVKALKAGLKQLGYFEEPITNGVYNSLIRDSIRRYEKDKNLWLSHSQSDTWHLFLMLSEDIGWENYKNAMKIYADINVTS